MGIKQDEKIKTCICCKRDYSTENQYNTTCSLECLTLKFNNHSFSSKKVTCLICDKAFIPTNKLNRLCSNACRYKAQRQKIRASKITVVCLNCNIGIKPEKKKRKYCSSKCKRAYYKKRDAKKC